MNWILCVMSGMFLFTSDYLPTHTLIHLGLCLNIRRTTYNTICNVIVQPTAHANCYVVTMDNMSYSDHINSTSVATELLFLLNVDPGFVHKPNLQLQL